MSSKIGRFEIIGQLAESSFATVYKALDPETQQTVALKVVRLDQVHNSAILLKAVLEESARARLLASQNIAALYAIDDYDGKLLIATEYVQGNSVAAMLDRKDGFSIWDIEDITRQVCQALDHARFHKAVHRSFEAGKVMVQWDGTVKVLGFGTSILSSHAMDSSTLPELLYYASPEQLRGEAGDHRMALFSLGAILYEMVTERKAFPGATAEEVRAAILECAPPLPQRPKAKLNPGLSALIMRALSKSPAERYQSGQELLRDLEQSRAGAKPTPQEKVQAQAAVAGAGGKTDPSLRTPPEPVRPGDTAPTVTASSASVSPTARSDFKVEPAIVEGDSPTPAGRKSFSDVSELPPLKEVILDGPRGAGEGTMVPDDFSPVTLKQAAGRKAKGEVREKAQRAIAEIRETPPRLYFYALAGAMFLIVLATAILLFKNGMEDREEGSGTVTSSSSQAQPPTSTAPAGSDRQAAKREPAKPETVRSEKARPSSPVRWQAKQPTTQSPALAQLAITSIPPQAGISFDGKPVCESPCTLTDIPPGQHLVVVAKAGYGSESRTLNLSAAASSLLSLQLNALPASLLVQSTPSGAAIEIDGQNTGKLTPSEFSLANPGVHTVLLKRSGYLEGTSSINTQLGRPASLNLTLEPLGSTEEIRSAGGKFKHLLSRGNASGMGVVQVKTQPKGAQIMVNDRVLDKTAPFDFYLNPGTYVIDISLSGYRPVHRVVKIEEGEKVAIAEALVPE